MTDDLFAVLGLPARGDLTDEDVRAAWRRVAAATHPDREDGGDPVRFGAAAAAYAVLRTSFGRGEALADLRAGGRQERHRRRARARSLSRSRARPHRHGRGAHRARAEVSLPRPSWNLGYFGNVGRPLALRVGGAAAAAAVTVTVVGWTPATIGLVTGALTVTGWGLWRQGGWGQ